MDRTISIEEKIKRAEEIYARRHMNSPNNTATFNLGNSEKKNIGLLKKSIIQMSICLFIYLGVYIVQNNNYIFSNDFISAVRELINTDTNFVEIYNNISGVISNIFNNKKNNENEQIEQQEQSQEKIDDINAKSKVEDKDNNEISDANIGGNVENTDNIPEEIPILSEEEQTILNIKNTATFIKPVEGPISSKYGYRNPTTSTVPKNHTGTDIAANLGTKILSSTDGEVVIASSEGDYGNHIKVQIGDVSVIYAHCNKLYVKQGDRVVQGQEIAEVGSTGNSTGPHLHFEIRFCEKTIDPEKILEL